MAVSDVAYRWWRCQTKTDSICAIASLARLLTLGLSADGTNDDAAEHTPPDTALDAAAAQQARADLGVSGVAF